MTKQIILSGIVVSMVIMGLPGCSKENNGTAPVATVEQKPTTFQAFTNLGDFKGKAPEALLSDEAVGAKLREILPNEQIACAKEIFNYMPDLEARPDGSLNAELHGSHAENWMHGLINVQQSGEINLLIDCSFGGKAEPYYLFTNKSVELESAKVVKEWVSDTGLNGDEMVVVSNGKEKRKVLLSNLVNKDQQNSAKNLAEQKTNSVTTKTASDTVAGRFEIINAKNNSGILSYNLNGKTVIDYDDTLGVTAEIYGVYVRNGRTLIVATWAVNEPKVGNAKYYVHFIEVNANGKVQKIFDEGLPSGEKKFDVTENEEKLEFKIPVDKNSGQIGYQRVLFEKNGARQISDWKWVDENKERERQRPRSYYVRAGATVCTSQPYLYAADNWDRGGVNSVPSGCTIFGADASVNIIKSITLPNGVPAYFVGNSGGTGYVRAKDVLNN